MARSRQATSETLDDVGLNGHYAPLRWSVPCEVDHKRKQLWITGEWTNGKLNGNCKIEFSNSEYPKLFGTFKNSIIQKGKMEFGFLRAINFDSIDISDLSISLYQGGHSFDHGGNPVMAYSRYFILHKCKYIDSGDMYNQLCVNGDMFCKQINYIQHKVDQDNAFCDSYIKHDYIGLLYYDLLSCFDQRHGYYKKIKPYLFRGTIKYNLHNCVGRCEMKLDHQLLDDEPKHKYQDNDKKKRVCWDIGQKLFETIISNQSRQFSQNEMTQLKICKDAPAWFERPAKIKITIDYQDGMDAFQHTHNNAYAFNLFDNNGNRNNSEHENDSGKCSYHLLSFIPKSGDILHKLLTKQQKSDDTDSDENHGKVQLVLNGNVNLNKNEICRFNATFVDTYDCTINVNGTTIFRGQCNKEKLAISSFFKMLDGKNEKDLHDHINEMKNIGCEIDTNAVSLTLVFEKIKQCGVDAVCNLLRVCCNAAKFDQTALMEWVTSENMNGCGFTRMVSGIQWEKLYKTQDMKIIESMIMAKQKQCTRRPQYQSICDSQEWNMLHYGAFFNDIKLIAIGQEYMDNAAADLEERALRSKGHKKDQNMFETLYLCKDIGGNLPIHIAAYFGNVEAIEILLKFESKCKCFKNANIRQLNDKNCDGCTPLAVALIHDRLECVKFLLKQPRMDVDTLMENKFSIFTLPASSRSWNTLQWLAKTFGKSQKWQDYVQSQDEFGQTIYDCMDQQAISLCRTKAPNWHKLCYSY